MPGILYVSDEGITSEMRWCGWRELPLHDRLSVILPLLYDTDVPEPGMLIACHVAMFCAEQGIRSVFIDTTWPASIWDVVAHRLSQAGDDITVLRLAA